MGAPRSEGLLVGICSTESQSPSYSQKPGPWLQMTDVLSSPVKVRGATLPFRRFTGKLF